jgi:hypothetical protein
VCVCVWGGVGAGRGVFFPSKSCPLSLKLLGTLVNVFSEHLLSGISFS